LSALLFFPMQMKSSDGLEKYLTFRNSSDEN